MIGKNPNPFVQNKQIISLRRCIELTIGAYLLLPLRLLTIAIGVIGCYIFARIGLSKKRKDENEKPIRGWRKVLAVNGISYITRVTMFICGFYRLKVKGPKPAPAYEAPVYIAAPKTSFLDEIVPLLIKTSPVNQHKAKEWPVLGAILRAMMSVFYSGELEMVDEVKTRASVAGWLPIMIFPEEANTNGETLIHFPSDVFQVMKPVQPVLISFSSSAYSSTIHQSPTVWKIFTFLCTLKHKLTIQYLDVIYPDVLKEESEKQFSTRVREHLATALSINTSEHSKEDVQLMKYARDLGLPALSGVVEFMSLKKEHDDLTLATAVKELIRFSQIDRRNKGVITQGDLADYLKESQTDISCFFNKYKLDSNGDLTFQSFLEGHLQQSKGPLSSPVEEGKVSFVRSRSNNLLLQRHTTPNPADVFY